MLRTTGSWLRSAAGRRFGRISRLIREEIIPEPDCSRPTDQQVDGVVRVAGFWAWNGRFAEGLRVIQKF
ncbi:hypothetical protein [Kribbella sp. NPDC055071]